MQGKKNDTIGAAIKQIIICINNPCKGANFSRTAKRLSSALLSALLAVCKLPSQVAFIGSMQFLRLTRNAPSFFI